ncbi:MAG: DivIVA domain-containing protein [Oscillospiraceae bacterium]|nr:DivIVA domain-containing protein [Oscillospiraceae bacterium]
MRGYKTEEVEEFLEKLSLDFSRLQKENEDLEKKLEVLADKIREYREDEDTLKDALLGAQRQGNALIADSKRKAAEVTEEAQEAAEAIAKKAEEGRLAKKKQGEDEIAAAKQEASDIIDAANKKAADIEREMNLRTDVQKEILHRTASEVSSHKAKILDHYRKEKELFEDDHKRKLETMEEHYQKEIAVIERIAQDCENEFIKNTLKEVRPFTDDDDLPKKSSKHEGKPTNHKDRKNKGGGFKSPKFETTDVSAAAKPNDGGDVVKFEIDVDGEPSTEATESESTPYFSTGNEQSNQDNKQTSEIFFKKSRTSSGRAKQVRFGGSSNEGEE